MIKVYKISDYTLTQTPEVDLWANLASNFFGYILEPEGEKMPDKLEIEFRDKFKDVTGEEHLLEHPLDPDTNFKAFERALKCYRVA